MSIPITEIPPDQRPRERLLSLGAQVLTDAELLAVVLRNGKRGENALELAAALLAEHGDLATLAQARPEEIARRTGIGAVKATGVVAAFHLGARVKSPTPVDLPRLAVPEDIAMVARPSFTGCRAERLVVFVCDARDRVRQKFVVAEGTVDRLPFPAREIFNIVLRNDGRSFALAHNHPSGNPEPSPADRKATARMEEAALAVGLRFLDHVVVAGDRWASICSEDRGG